VQMQVNYFYSALFGKSWIKGCRGLFWFFPYASSALFTESNIDKRQYTCTKC
jgi:hypothetical protein